MSRPLRNLARCARALTGDTFAPLPGLAANGVVAGECGHCVTISATMKDRSADRHLARRERTHYVGTCSWCGDLIMHSADLPGRGASLCSPRCRQAAYPARLRRQPNVRNNGRGSHQ